MTLSLTEQRSTDDVPFIETEVVKKAPPVFMDVDLADIEAKVLAAMARGKDNPRPHLFVWDSVPDMTDSFFYGHTTSNGPLFFPQMEMRQADVWRGMSQFVKRSEGMFKDALSKLKDVQPCVIIEDEPDMSHIGRIDYISRDAVPLIGLHRPATTTRTKCQVMKTRDNSEVPKLFDWPPINFEAFNFDKPEDSPGVKVADA